LCSESIKDDVHCTLFLLEQMTIFWFGCHFYFHVTVMCRFIDITDSSETLADTLYTNSISWFRGALPLQMSLLLNGFKIIKFTLDWQSHIMVLLVMVSQWHIWTLLYCLVFSSSYFADYVFLEDILP
jgi:hypothetical protein